MSCMKEFTKGLIKENPNLVMLLGMCPTLAVTTMAQNGLGMGLATTFVLVCSNLVISLLKKFIPDTVRLPCFIVIIAGFVTFVSIMLGHKNSPQEPINVNTASTARVGFTIGSTTRVNI